LSAAGGVLNKFRAIFGAARDPILLFALGEDFLPTAIVNANPAAVRLLGRSRRDLLRLNPLELMGTERRKHVEEIRDILRRQGACVFIDRLRAADGTAREVEVSLTVVKIDGRTFALNISRDLTEQRKTEQALRESEQTFLALAEQSPTMIFINQGGKIVYANPSCEKLMGYSRAEFYADGFDFLRLIMPEHHPAIRENFQIHQNGQEVTPIEYALRTKTGPRLSAITSTRLIYFRGGRAILGVVTDITERKRAEAELENYRLNLEQLVEERTAELSSSEQKFRALVDNIAVGISLISPEMRIVTLNAQMRRWFPAADPAAAPLCYRSFNNPPRDQVCSYCPTIQTLRDGQVHEAVTETPAGGGIVNYRVISSPITDSRGKVIAAIELVDDITAQRQTEEELEKYRRRLEDLVRERTEQLRRSEEIFRIAAQSTSDLIYDWDIGSQRLEWLGNIDRALGYESGEFPRTISAWENAIHPEDRGRVLAALRDHLERRREWEQEYRIRTKGGSYRHWLDHGSAIRTADGAASRMIGCCADVTEKNRMEEELLKAQKLESVGLLAGGIAHDFNNILTGILGHISLGRLIAPPESKIARTLSEAEKSCLRAKALTQQLLTFSHGGAPVKKAGHLGALLQETAEFVLHGSRIKVRLAVADDLWPVEMDEGQISQVINNIVLNAVQAMPEAGTIAIRAANVFLDGESGLLLNPGPYVEVEISDQGAGIPSEHLPRVFDPYFTTKQKGSGLGLAIAYSIVKHHGGVISVASEAGQGSTFIIRLPAAPGAAIAPAPEAELPPVRGTGKILVVDDEETVRRVATEILSHLGYEAKDARGSSEAIELYAQARAGGAPFSAVIMDLTIPGDVDGVAVASRILELDPAARIIVSSGYAVSPIMSDYAAHGFVGAIAKPYQIRELSEVLGRVLNLKSEI
jgi:PAS domain S-box-containing protein